MQKFLKKEKINEENPGNTGFLGRRQQYMSFQAKPQICFKPKEEQTAGMVVLQIIRKDDSVFKKKKWYFFTLDLILLCVGVFFEMLFTYIFVFSVFGSRDVGNNFERNYMEMG